MNQPLIPPCSQCRPSLNCWSGATECEHLKRISVTQPPIDNAHVAPGCEQFGSPTWGIEETTHNIYVGPLRADGKINEIVYHVSVFCITDEAFARHRRNAQLVCDAVNSYLRIRDALTKKL